MTQTQPCILTHRTEPDRERTAAPGLLVCWGCRGRIRGQLLGIPDQLVDLDRAHQQSLGAGGGGGAGKPESQPPGRLEIMDAAELLRSTLFTTARVVVEDREQPGDAELAQVRSALAATTDPQRRAQLQSRLDPAAWRLVGPASADPAVVAAWLEPHVDWLCRQPWIDETDAELRERTGRAHGLCDRPARRWLAGPCPQKECEGTIVGLEKSQQDTEWACDVCGHEVSWMSLRAQRKPVGKLVDIPQALVYLDISRSTLNRWRVKELLPVRARRPKTNRPLFLLEDLRRLADEHHVETNEAMLDHTRPRRRVVRVSQQHGA